MDRVTNEDEEASKKLTAMAKAGSSIRANCDACRAKRPRWFCAADAAYLCHACDTSIHAANFFACRHQRVKLSTRSEDRYGALFVDSETSCPRKKTRSERRHNFTLAPSLNRKRERESERGRNQGEGEGSSTGPHPQPFLYSDSDLFLPEVEDLNLASFISPQSHGNSYNNDNCEESNPIGDGEAAFSWLFERVKIEESEDGHTRVDTEAEELFDLNIDLFDAAANLEEGEKSGHVNEVGKKICLSLNCEDVLSAWSDRGSPWADHNTMTYQGTVKYTHHLLVAQTG